MDYVNRRMVNGQDPKEAKLQEAVTDFQRWSAESKIFTGREENSKGMKWVTGFEYRKKKKENGETKTM